MCIRDRIGTVVVVVVVVVLGAVVVLVVVVVALERNLGGSEATVEVGGMTSAGASVVAFCPTTAITMNSAHPINFISSQHLSADEQDLLVASLRTGHLHRLCLGVSLQRCRNQQKH